MVRGELGDNVRGDGPGPIVRPRIKKVTISHLFVKPVASLYGKPSRKGLSFVNEERWVGLIIDNTQSVKLISQRSLVQAAIFGTATWVYRWHPRLLPRIVKDAGVLFYERPR